MHSQFLMAALLVGYGVAVPLNINLGAYSPALVVGDGEISFGGKADVTNLMNALEGAAVNGAAAAANGQAAPAATQPAAARPVAAAPTTAEGAATVQPAEGQQAAQIASLQGMGEKIAPRVVTMEADKKVLNRDLSGFNAALKYASDALSKQPEVQLGTEAAGVGIIVRPGSVTGEAGRPATAPAARRVKRDEPKLKTTITTMFIRGGPAPAELVARSPANDVISKRTASPSLDGVNLNMAEGQVAELTFVETRAVDGDEEEEDEE